MRRGGQLLECARTFSDEDRRTLVLASGYQLVRRELANQWIVIFGTARGPQIKRHRLFRTFETVRKWLEAGGWRISWMDYHWMGYLRFVFKTLSPTVPHPGQLKNKKLLGDYMSKLPEADPGLVQRDAEQLRDLYARVFDMRGDDG